MPLTSKDNQTQRLKRMNLVPILVPTTRLSIFKSSETLLRESIIANDIKQAKKILERDESIINRDISEGDSHENHLGYAPLHYACEYNAQVKILEILLKKKAMVNIRTNNEDDRSTPLHIAVKYGKVDIINYLLRHQANPNDTDYLGETVLMKASVKNELGIMDTLLSCGASVNARDFRGQTALMMAVKARQIPALQLLLGKHRLLVNEQDHAGNTALMRAVQLNSLDAVYFLLQHPSIDVNLKNERDETALMMAAAGGYSTIVEWLLEKEAHSTSTNADDETALDILHKHKSINPLIKHQIHHLLAKAEAAFEGVAEAEEEDEEGDEEGGDVSKMMRGLSEVKLPQEASDEQERAMGRSRVGSRVDSNIFPASPNRRLKEYTSASSKTNHTSVSSSHASTPTTPSVVLT